MSMLSLWVMSAWRGVADSAAALVVMGILRPVVVVVAIAQPWAVGAGAVCAAGTLMGAVSSTESARKYTLRVGEGPLSGVEKIFRLGSSVNHRRRVSGPVMPAWMTITPGG